MIIFLRLKKNKSTRVCLFKITLFCFALLFFSKCQEYILLYSNKQQLRNKCNETQKTCFFTLTHGHRFLMEHLCCRSTYIRNTQCDLCTSFYFIFIYYFYYYFLFYLPNTIENYLVFSHCYPVNIMSKHSMRLFSVFFWN